MIQPRLTGFLRFTGALIDDRLLPWPISTMAARGYRSAAPGIVALRNVAPPEVKIESMALYDGSQRVIDLYDPATNVLIGNVGPFGFASGSAAKVGSVSRRASEPCRSGKHAHAGFFIGRLLDGTRHGRVRKVFEATADDPGRLPLMSFPPQKDPLIVVATQARCTWCDRAAKFCLQFHSIRPNEYAIQAAFIPANHHLVLRAEAISPGLEDQSPPRFWEYAANGALVRQNSAPVKNETDDVTMARTAAFGAIHPLLGRPVNSALDRGHGVRAGFATHGRLFLLCSLATSVLSSLAAVSCWDATMGLVQRPSRLGH